MSTLICIFPSLRPCLWVCVLENGKFGKALFIDEPGVKLILSFNKNYFVAC